MAEILDGPPGDSAVRAEGKHRITGACPVQAGTGVHGRQRGPLQPEGGDVHIRSAVQHLRGAPAPPGNTATTSRAPFIRYALVTRMPGTATRNAAPPGRSTTPRLRDRGWPVGRPLGRGDEGEQGEVVSLTGLDSGLTFGDGDGGGQDAQIDAMTDDHQVRLARTGSRRRISSFRRRSARSSR